MSIWSFNNYDDVSRVAGSARFYQRMTQIYRMRAIISSTVFMAPSLSELG